MPIPIKNHKYLKSFMAIEADETATDITKRNGCIAFEFTNGDPSPEEQEFRDQLFNRVCFKIGNDSHRLEMPGNTLLISPRIPLSKELAESVVREIVQLYGHNPPVLSEGAPATSASRVTRYGFSDDQPFLASLETCPAMEKNGAGDSMGHDAQDRGYIRLRFKGRQTSNADHQYRLGLVGLINGILGPCHLKRDEGEAQITFIPHEGKITDSKIGALVEMLGEYGINKLPEGHAPAGETGKEVARTYFRFVGGIVHSMKLDLPHAVKVHFNKDYTKLAKTDVVRMLSETVGKGDVAYTNAETRLTYTPTDGVTSQAVDALLKKFSENSHLIGTLINGDVITLVAVPEPDANADAGSKENMFAGRYAKFTLGDVRSVSLEPGDILEKDAPLGALKIYFRTKDESRRAAIRTAIKVMANGGLEEVVDGEFLRVIPESGVLTHGLVQKTLEALALVTQANDAVRDEYRQALQKFGIGTGQPRAI